MVSFFACKKDKPLEKYNNYTITSTFSIPADSISLNPSGNAPLSALVHFTTNVSGHTEIIVKGKNGAASDIVQKFTDNGTHHAIPLVGLYPFYYNTIEIYVVYNDHSCIKAEVHIQTENLPANTPNYIKTDVLDLAHMESGVNLVSGFSGFPTPPQTAYITDSWGEIRWCLDFSKHPQLNKLFFDCGISRLENGNYYFADQASDKIYEVDILGKIIKTWDLGGYIFHHNVTEKPNGNFLISVSLPGSTHTDNTPTVEDFIIEIDRNSSAIVNTWDLRQSLDEYRMALGQDTKDWVHVNAVIYDPSDNTIIVSGRVQGIIKLTNDNHVKWILGPHLGWGRNRRGEDLNQYLLTPLDKNGTPIQDPSVINGNTDHSDFEWNWDQHSPVIMPNGNLIMFDNGSARNFNAGAPIHYSRAVEYKINASTMTVQQVWDYGKERAAETYSLIVSSVKYLPKTNHILFSPGYQVPNLVGLGGKMVEIDYATKQVIFQQSVSSANGFAWHRVQRLEMYPNGNPYK